MNKYISKSMKLQLLFSVVVSFGVAGVAFCLSFFVGNLLLDQTVYGNSFAEEMAAQHFYKLQEFVEKEKISLDNLQRLNAWSTRGEKVYLTLYHDDMLIYEFPSSGDLESHSNVLVLEPDREDSDKEYSLKLQNGIKVRAFLYYYAGDAFYFWLIALSGITAFVSFSLCFVSLINRKISYITILRKELDILSGGQLGYVVTVNGRDELSELALGIDQMRRSIIKHQEIEKQIRTANSELITAMSHDLRTPLTSLLAYLEIIERKKYANDEQMHNLIHKSVEQTMRIKNMADKLFEYFLMYATEWDYSEMEILDADQLFSQILEDYAYSLENSDMSVEREFFQASGQISVNIELLQRVLDNIYSNLIKYADKEHPIRISYKREEDNLLLEIVNKVHQKMEKRDSTSIGLNTCNRIIKCHNGRFVAEERDDLFYISIHIPIKY